MGRLCFISLGTRSATSREVKLESKETAYGKLQKGKEQATVAGY